MLRSERDLHLRRAATAETERDRLRSLGVVEWLEDWIDGGMGERLNQNARRVLGLDEDEPLGYEDGGSIYMEGDGLSGED